MKGLRVAPLNPPLPAWPECTVWLIGASSGIGAALARHLLDAGARVALSARRVEELERVADGHSRALCLPLDFTDTAAFTTSWRRLRRRWGKVDLVIFNAGIYQPTRAWTLAPDDIDKVLDTNVGAIMRGCSVLMPSLLKDGHGALAFTSSVAAYGGMTNCLTYGPSKAALSNFAEALYLDLHSRGIGVHLISPGFVRTPGTEVNEFTMPALIEPAQAAREIARGLRRGEFDIHFPKRFTRVLKALKALPYRAYFQAVLKATANL